MLLSSTAFSGFLNELSANGMPAPPTSASNQHTQTKPQPRPTRKDVNPHQAARQMQNQQPQINMAMIPETDFSVLDQSANNWSSIPSNDFQVYSISAVPQVPALDLASLSGKTSSSPLNVDSSKEVPQLPEVPAWVKTTSEPAATKSTSEECLDEAFALYNDTPSTPSTSSSLESYLASAKPESNKFALAITQSSNLAQLKRVCAALDETCERLAAYLPAE